jgi:UDP-glucose:(heptosyl)LPS alpha-1,3-glucosyltransferase
VRYIQSWAPSNHVGCKIPGVNACEANDVRIAVISPFVDRQHGTERAVAELLDRLSTQHRDTIDLYAQKVSDLDCNTDSAAGTNDSGKIICHRVNSLPAPHLIQFLGWLFLNHWTRWRHKHASHTIPEVVFSPGINTLDADLILVHAVFHRIAELQRSRDTGGLRGLHRKLYYALMCSLERRIYRDPRVSLAAVSRHTAAQLARYFGRNDVTVIPNGVDAEHFSQAAIAAMRERYRLRWHCSPRDFVLLLVGNDWRNKGLKTLLRAVAQCVAQRPTPHATQDSDTPLRLLVVGQDEQAPFRLEAEKLGIAEHVQFLAPAQDVRIFYAAADALVAPSLEDSFNLPVLEAMSCGLPVVVSPAAGVSDWLAHGKDSLVLEDPQNAGELAAAIRFLTADPLRREAIASNGLRTAAKFSWDAHANELRKLLVNVAEKKILRKSPQTSI